MPDDKNGNQFCPVCGLQKAKQSAPGSITGYIFDPVRCKCTNQSGVPGPTFKPGALDGRTFSAVGAATPTEMQLHEGDLVGGSYSIIELIGSGGMGVVYLARHVGLGKRCAIKLIPPDQLTSTAWGRFQLEAKSVAKLDHKNIVKVTDLGLHKGYMPFYAMEYIKGRSLADRLAQDGPLPLKDALSIFIQICEGVDYAHRAGIIHRDLKPANIMLGDDGTVKILDFGLAKLAHQNRNEQSLTAVGDIFGSPYYMSPEQCAGEKVDNRSDIYSLGCTLFECLTGRPPFAGSISSAVMFAQQESPPPSLESVLGKNKMPESIEIILAKILRKNPAERYQTCRELGVDLQRGLDGKNVEPVYVDRGAKKSTDNSQASIQTASPPATQPAQSRAPKIFVTLALTLLLIGAVAGSAVYSYLKSRTAISHHSELLRDTETPLLVTSHDLAREKNRLRTVPPSANLKSYYSTAESAGRTIKTFNFPSDVRIGVISNDMTFDTPAVGKVIIDSTDLKFWPGPATIKNPQYFARFRPGEISKVMFSGQNLDLSFDTLEDNFEDVNACCHALTFLPDWQDLPGLGLWHLNQALTPASVKVLSSLKSLRSLDIAGPATDCKALARMPFIPKLVEANLSGLRDYLSLFKGFEHLTLMRIDRANFSDEELEALSEIKSLNSLKLETEKVTTRDLSRLAALKSIQNLSLHYSTLRDYSAVKTLKLFPSLRWLRIVGVPPTDQRRLESLRRSLPAARVDFVETFYGP